MRKRRSRKWSRKGPFRSSRAWELHSGSTVSEKKRLLTKSDFWRGPSLYPLTIGPPQMDLSTGRTLVGKKKRFFPFFLCRLVTFYNGVNGICLITPLFVDETEQCCTFSRFKFYEQYCWRLRFSVYLYVFFCGGLNLPHLISGNRFRVPPQSTPKVCTMVKSQRCWSFPDISTYVGGELAYN